MSQDAAPEFPNGAYEVEKTLSTSRRSEILDQVAAFPQCLRDAVEDLSVSQLESVYRNWSILQIVHHLADAQMNWFLRFKMALTTLQPTVMPYDQSEWVNLTDATDQRIDSSLAIISGVNQRWAELGKWVLPEDFARTMLHSEHNQPLTLDHALSLSTWHCYHHLAQIQWMRANRFEIVAI